MTTTPAMRGPRRCGPFEIEAALAANEIHIRLRDGRSFMGTVVQKLRAGRATLRPWGSCASVVVAVEDVAAVSVVSGISWEMARQIARDQKATFG